MNTNWRDLGAGGRILGCKQRGEWAELVFMARAAGEGLAVTRPFGESRYDVGVEYGRRYLRVQVKSTIYKRRGDGYSLNVMGPKRTRYEEGALDFFAIYLIPIDAWYIIPYEVMGRTNCSVHFTPSSTRHKYAGYREAWHLLRGEGQLPALLEARGWGRRGARKTAGRIEILHGCVELDSQFAEVPRSNYDPIADGRISVLV